MLTIPTDFCTSNYRTALAVPTFLSFVWSNVLLLDLPESPRYLFSKGLVAQCVAEITCIGIKNRRPLPSNITIVETVAGKKEPVHRSHGLMDLWKNQRLRSLTANLCFQWFVIGVQYYGLTLASSQFPGTVHFNLFLAALVEIPAYYAAFRCMDVYGRRLVFLISHAIVLGACVSYLMLPRSGAVAAALRTGERRACIVWGGRRGYFRICFASKLPAWRVSKARRLRPSHGREA